MTNQLDFEVFSGKEISTHVEDLARLRMKVFRDFPYLYEGSMEYEVNYLKTLLKSSNSIMVIALDQQRIVGVSTGLPLEDEEDFIKAPFENSMFKNKKGFYFSESILLQEYRGQGAGRKFFEFREAKARSLGSDFATFCAVIRPNDHISRPKDYTPLDSFWKSVGFNKVAGLITQMSWCDIGDKVETGKSMQYWVKEFNK